MNSRYSGKGILLVSTAKAAGGAAQLVGSFAQTFAFLLGIEILFPEEAEAKLLLSPCHVGSA